VDVVLLNATKVRVDGNTEPHLFWLARGGGGNIFPGVATAFHFELVPMPVSPATYSMEWDATKECRKTLPALWYKRMAIHPDVDLFAKITFSNGGQPKVAIDVTYIGDDTNSAEELLRAVGAASACGAATKTRMMPNTTWTSVVLFANGGDERIGAPGNNNCGWDLSGPTPQRTDCQGYDTSYTNQWASRSLVTGAGGRVPQGVWDALAEDNMYNGYFVEIEPSNGFAGTVAKDATAYPHRDTGSITLQIVMASSGDISGFVRQSAETMRAITAHVPRLGYYNYLDKNMHQYSGLPRDAYYGGNADKVEAYVREYTDGLDLHGGCSRRNSWELARA